MLTSRDKILIHYVVNFADQEFNEIGNFKENSEIAESCISAIEGGALESLKRLVLDCTYTVDDMEQITGHKLTDSQVEELKRRTDLWDYSDLADSLEAEIENIVKSENQKGAKH